MELEITDLGKKYNGFHGRNNFTALENVNLKVVSGEFVSIVGPSGCGKTTLLEIVAGLQDHDTGRIVIDGVALHDCRANRAIVFQQYALFPWLTVRKNIEFGLKVRGVSKSERNRVSGKFIEMVGLAGFERFYPHQLSGGMQQRVALGRALANEPDILLLDEPFAALDAQTKEVCQRELLRIWRQTKVTVLFVTHDVGEAIFLSDRVMVMTGSPGTVKDTLGVELERPRDYQVRLDRKFREMEFHLRTLITDNHNS